MSTCVQFTQLPQFQDKPLSIYTGPSNTRGVVSLAFIAYVEHHLGHMTCVSVGYEPC